MSAVHYKELIEMAKRKFSLKEFNKRKQKGDGKPWDIPSKVEMATERDHELRVSAFEAVCQGGFDEIENLTKKVINCRHRGLLGCRQGNKGKRNSPWCERCELNL